jgi:hypothetical protein
LAAYQWHGISIQIYSQVYPGPLIFYAGDEGLFGMCQLYQFSVGFQAKPNLFLWFYY